jgi:hypothetical protein
MSDDWGAEMHRAKPVNQSRLEPSNFEPGGRYIRLHDGRDITGITVARALIGMLAGEPVLRVSEAVTEPATRRDGAMVKVNLIRATVGWKWLEKATDIDTTIITTVETGQHHYYALEIRFEDGVTLSRYPNARSEPRLRPTTYGLLDLGEPVGRIDLRGRVHPVYERITIRKHRL